MAIRSRPAAATGFFGLCILGCAVVSTANAQSVEQFYKSNPLVFLVGHAAGGGYDVYTRTLARHMVKYIPGHPTIIVKNMLGAGGITMINHLYTTAPRDGSTFGISDRGYVLEPLLGNKAATFDATKMNALGSIGKQTPACSLWHGARAKSLDDTFKQETLIGGTGPSATTIYPAILNNVIKTRFKIIAGYKGSGEIMLAMERGEVEGVCLSWNTLRTVKPDWLADGKLRPIVLMAFKRDPQLKDVPTALEHAPTEAERNMLSVYFGPNEMGRPYIGPPGIPQDRLQAVRRAFDATMKDPAYIAEAESQQMDVEPMTGEEMQDLIKSFYATPPEILARLKVAIDEYRKRK
jgi:tripartite-type tricarboxylate transporter receptor subunit TctC